MNQHWTCLQTANKLLNLSQDIEDILRGTYVDKYGNIVERLPDLNMIREKNNAIMQAAAEFLGEYAP